MLYMCRIQILSIWVLDYCALLHWLWVHVRNGGSGGHKMPPWEDFFFLGGKGTDVSGQCEIYWECVTVMRSWSTSSWAIGLVCNGQPHCTVNTTSGQVHSLPRGVAVLAVLKQVEQSCFSLWNKTVRNADEIFMFFLQTISRHSFSIQTR